MINAKHQPLLPSPAPAPAGAGQPLRRRSMSGSSSSSSSPQKECIVCSSIPDSIICLGCSHDICILCAARTILGSTNLKDIDISQLECPLCKQVTYLSEEVQVTLVEFLQSEELEFDAEEAEEEEEEDAEGAQEEEAEEEEAEEEEQELSPQARMRQGQDQQIGDEEDQAAEEEEEEEEEVVNQEMVGQPKDFRDAINERFGKREKNNEIQEHSRAYSKKSDARDASVDISFHFACLEHPNEEYAYYSPSSKGLYCAQCILTDRQLSKLKDIRSLRRSLPLIMQHFQDLLNNVEVSKSLLENRKRDSEIKLDDIKAKMNSIKYFVEMRFEELIENINEIKTTIIDNLDSTMEKMLDDLKGLGERFTTKIDYFEAVIAQVRDIQTQDDNCDEDLLGFFFANQARIGSVIKEESGEDQLNNILEECHTVEVRIDKEMKLEMSKSVNKIAEVLGDAFKEFLGCKKILIEHEAPSQKNTFFGRQMTDRTTNQRRPPSPEHSTNMEVLLKRNLTVEKDSTNSTHIMSKNVNNNRYNMNSRPLSNTRMDNKRAAKDPQFMSIGGVGGTTKKAAPPPDPITDIQKKLSAFDLRNLHRPATSASRVEHGPPTFGEYKPSGGFLNMKEPKMKNIDSLRVFRQKIREKLSIESVSKRNRSFFMS